MRRVLLNLALPDVEVTITADDEARWVGVFDGAALVGLAELTTSTTGRRAHLFVPAGIDTGRLRVEVAAHPSELAS